MKRILNKIKIRDIFAFILGGLIIGSIGVYASNILLGADQVQYTNTKTVQKAIEELYKLAENCSSDECPEGMNCLTDAEKIALQNTYLNSCPSGVTCFGGSVSGHSINTELNPKSWTV